MGILNILPPWAVLMLSALLAAGTTWQVTGDWVSALMAGIASLIGVGVAGAKALGPRASK